MCMKKSVKYVWKGLLVLAVVVFVVSVVIRTYAWWKEYNDYWGDEYISEYVSKRYYCEQNEYKVYNHRLGKIMAEDIDCIVNPTEGDSLTVFFQGSLRGFLNVNTGRVVIPAQYRRAWVFSEGLAAVVDETGMVGFINRDNEVVIPCQFDYHTDNSTEYIFHNGYCVMTGADGNCGVIDHTGRWLMEPKYDYIWALAYGKYRIVREGEKYGLIDENLTLIFPVEYDNIDYAGEESDGVVLTKGHIKQQIAFDGTIINPFVFDGCSELYYLKQIAPMVTRDADGDAIPRTEIAVLSDYLIYRVGYNEGVMHRETGEVIIPAIYNDIEMVSPTLFYAELNGVDGGILFDLNGRQVE